MIAAQNGRLAIVRYLVGHGADLTLETVAGENVLDYAAHRPTIVAFLKSAGAQPSSYATELQNAFGGGHG